MAFDAFISYSHAADGKLAPALQRGLQQLAKPWSRRQALRIFRDDTGLAVNPALWQSITNAMDESEHFVLLASPGAAQSEWVNREVAYWMASRPDAAERMLPVLTAGTWAWDESRGEIDWAASTAAPPALAGVFASEPRHLDLVWAQSQDDLDLRNTRFRDAVADLAAPIHGIPKDELESEDVRQHRKALRLRRGAVAALLLLVVGVGIAGVLALRAADTARGALRDLEDANGNIDQLSAEGARLAQANQDAAADLAETQTARDDAEAQATAARAAADAAEDARASAEAAQLAAEDAQATAEAEQQEAEAARADAIAAQALAEHGRDEAEAAAADAAAAEAEARRQEEQARAGEQAAIDAEAAAEAASAAARAAEAQARADELAAREAGEQATLQEAEARRAEAAAQAGERLARAAEEEAVAAEEAARAAEEVAREEEQEARTAEAAAVEAAAAAQLRREEAEAATLAASLAQAASSQSDPSVNALLSVESYCAVGSCDAADRPQGLRAIAAAQPVGGSDPEQLDPLIAMLDSLSTHQDLLGPLPGWVGRAEDVAISGDGRTIAAVGDDDVIRLWHPGAPLGEQLPALNTIGVGVSDDGSTIAYVTARRIPDGSAMVGAFIEIVLVNPSGEHQASGLLVNDIDGTPAARAELSFRPGSNDVVLVNFGGESMLFDPATVGEPPDYRLSPGMATWVPDGQLAVFGPGEAYTALADGTPLLPIESAYGGTPTAVASVGSRVVVGYDDGTVGIVLERRMLSAQLHLNAVTDVAISADTGSLVSSAADGSVVRTRLTPVRLGPSVVSAVRSRRPISLGSARGADVLVVAVDERVERRTAALSWAGQFATDVRPMGPPAGRGAVLVRTDLSGVELVAPEGVITVEGAEAEAVLSNDGSTAVVGGGRPRVGRVGAFSGAVALQLAPDEVSADDVMAIDADGSTAAVVLDGPGLERGVVTFDAATGRRLASVELASVIGEAVFNGAVTGLLVSDDALAIRRQEQSGSFDRRDDRIELRGRDGALVTSIPDRPGGSPMWMTSGADGTLFVARADGVIAAYPTAGGDPTEALDVGDDDAVTAIGTDPAGGALMVVGYRSGRVELWNLENGAFLVELSHHSVPVTHAVIGDTPAGLRVTTSAAVQNLIDEVVVRTLDDPDLLRRALCDLSGRDLTPAEWLRFVGAGTPPSCRRGLP